MTKEAKILISLTIVCVVAIVVFAVIFGKETPTTTTAATPNKKLSLPSYAHTTGDPKAKVQMIEFGDYQCPSCGAAYPVVKQLIKDYGNKILFVFRNFPLPQHQNAKIAAEAAEAAGAQGKYWQMHDWLYETQNTWAESDHPLDMFKKEAETLGLDVDKFTSQVNANAFDDRITQDQNAGDTLGVQATPTFFINGNPVVGGDYNTLKQEIDKDLAK